MVVLRQPFGVDPDPWSLARIGDFFFPDAECIPRHPVIPPQEVFWVHFGGPNTCSAGVWMSRGIGYHILNHTRESLSGLKSHLNNSSQIPLGLRILKLNFFILLDGVSVSNLRDIWDFCFGEL